MFACVSVSALPVNVTLSIPKSFSSEVEVLEKSGNGWWLVRIKNELGWAPSTYLKKVAMDAIITVEPELRKQPSS